MTNIREREIRVISKMLDLADGQSQPNFGDQWKVLMTRPVGTSVLC